MADRENRGPVVFVKAKKRNKKDGSGSFISVNTFDLDVVREKLGPVVSGILTKPKKPMDGEDERVLILERSERKWLPKKREDGGGSSYRKSEGEGGGQQRSRQDDFVD